MRWQALELDWEANTWMVRWHKCASFGPFLEQHLRAARTGTGSLFRQQHSAHQSLEGKSTWMLHLVPLGTGVDCSCPVLLRQQPGTTQIVTVELWVFFTLLLQLPRAGQTASYPQTAPLTSSADLFIPFHPSQPLISLLLYLLVSTSVSSQINNFKLLFPPRHQIWYFWFFYLSDMIYLIELRGFGSCSRLSFPKGPSCSPQPSVEFGHVSHNTSSAA